MILSRDTWPSHKLLSTETRWVYPRSAECLGAVYGQLTPQRVRLLPNPASFSINEIAFSVTSVDVLFHLRREEVLQRAEEAEPDPEQGGEETKDAMAGLVRHILGQRTFYPIFPPGESYASEVNLDTTHQRLMRLDESAPDVLIVPSKLRHFSKVRLCPEP